MSDPRDTVTAMYNPWRALRALAHLDITWHDLGPHGRGHTDGRTITISTRLGQAERRSTLAHELVHAERGTRVHPAFRDREEEVVERIAARRLIELDTLVDVLLWWGGMVHDAAADDLWVDLDVLEARIRDLTDDEVAYVRARFDRLEAAA